MPDLIDRAEVAHRLGISLDKLYQRLPQLRTNPVNPFPGPVLGNMRGARWDPAAIDRWIAAGGEHATQPPAAGPAAAPGPGAIAVSDALGAPGGYDEGYWAAELLRRSKALAAGE